MAPMPATVAPASPAQAAIPGGVPPLKAGQGHSFFLRRLHSLTGIVPVGAFLIEHILVSNATAINGPEAYANQVKFLGSLPMVLFLEAFGIWLPILFHGGYGLVIWWRGESNVRDYPWTGNWMYTLQRWTGIIAFAYIAWHTWHLRFAGIDLHAHPGASFGKVQSELLDTWWGGPAYMVGLIAASWHLAYGIWLFCAKWGITVGEKARKKFLIVCVLFFFVMTGVGWMSLRSFFMHPRVPADESADQLRTKPAPPTPPLGHK